MPHREDAYGLDATKTIKLRKSVPFGKEQRKSCMYWPGYRKFEKGRGRGGGGGGGGGRVGWLSYCLWYKIKGGCHIIDRGYGVPPPLCIRPPANLIMWLCLTLF